MCVTVRSALYLSAQFLHLFSPRMTPNCVESHAQIYLFLCFTFAHLGSVVLLILSHFILLHLSRLSSNISLWWSYFARSVCVCAVCPISYQNDGQTNSQLYLLRMLNPALLWILSIGRRYYYMSLVPRSQWKNGEWSPKKTRTHVQWFLTKCVWCVLVNFKSWTSFWFSVSELVPLT